MQRKFEKKKFLILFLKLSENGISINFVLLDAFRKDLESAMENFKIEAETSKLFNLI